MRLICLAKHRITPLSPPLKPCKDCKHFQALPPSSIAQNIKYGKCRLFGLQDLVDGSIEYEFAGISRQYHCKGEYFEQNHYNHHNHQNHQNHRNHQNHHCEPLRSIIDVDPPRTYDN